MTQNAFSTEEFNRFCKENSQAYTPQLEHQQRSGSKWQASWHWPAFFFPEIWFLYRKMWLHFLLLALISMMLQVFFGFSPVMAVLGLILRLTIAIFAKSLYIQIAVQTSKATYSLGLGETDRQNFLQRTGGTSQIGLGIGIIMMAFETYVTYQMILSNPKILQTLQSLT